MSTGDNESIMRTLVWLPRALPAKARQERSMSGISRRDFLRSAATYAATAGFLSSGALELSAKDFPGTIKQLAGAGFETIELCSPVGYADSGFAGLGKYTGSELRRILGDSGVTCVSSHFSIEELRKNQESPPPVAKAPAWPCRSSTARSADTLQIQQNYT